MRRVELIFLLSASGVGYSPSAAARRDGAIAEATKRGRTASGRALHARRGVAFYNTARPK
jgi:hypothetical protein